MSAERSKQILGKPLYTTLRKSGLKPQYILFVAEYIANGFNATDAYRKTLARKNTTYESMKAQSVVVLSRPEIRETIQTIVDHWVLSHEETFKKRILQVYMQRAFYDPSDFITPEGGPAFSSWAKLPEEKRCVIEGIEKRYYGKDADRSSIVLKLADREKALNSLSRYINLFKSADDGGRLNLNLPDETVQRLEKIFRRKDGKSKIKPPAKAPKVPQEVNQN